MKLRLFSYFRSSASYRVRIGLNLKKLDYEYIPVNLLKGEQKLPQHLEKNPSGQIPCLELDGKFYNQSMAIFSLLDDLKTEPLLFTRDCFHKAKIIEICELVNSGIQPLQNMNVLKELNSRFNADDAQKNAWAHHWNLEGLKSLEALISKTAREYAFHDTITAADCFIQPQLFSARRFNVDIKPFPVLARLESAYSKIDAFERAHPDNQPDTPK
jgi:maleylacetoacetate isomerase